MITYVHVFSRYYNTRGTWSLICSYSSTEITLEGQYTPCAFNDMQCCSHVHMFSLCMGWFELTLVLIIMNPHVHRQVMTLLHGEGRGKACVCVCVCVCNKKTHRGRGFEQGPHPCGMGALLISYLIPLKDSA